VSAHADTAAARYARRREAWQRHHRHLPLVRHHGWWLLHNVVTHPLLGIVPWGGFILFHDWTSMHLNHHPAIRPSTPPVIPPGRRWAWTWHNVVGHLAIGLLPVGPVFAFHDRTADAMMVEDWV
jgi:hypothetical protein